MGAHLLTHLLGQDLEGLSQKIAIYRSAYRAGGHAGDGHVALMLHTFVGEDAGAVKATVHDPLCRYLEQSVDLIRPLARALNLDMDEKQFGRNDLDALLEHAFERYHNSSALIGDETQCLRMLQQIVEADVDEVACLVDFGVETAAALEGLVHLANLKDRWNRAATSQDASPGWRESQMQCTPSFASALLDQWNSDGAQFALKRMLVGGEALPGSLASQLRDVVTQGVFNMYGPTETTIWSSVHRCEPRDDGASAVSIGRPIANTQMYVLDEWWGPVPLGAEGELYIGGDGLARGYWQRAGLTAERFVPNPFGAPGTRLYRTGDVVKRNHEGSLEYIGRKDQQVKLRGHRIELGEIESVLCEHPGVGQAAAAVRDHAEGDRRLVVYWVASGQPSDWPGVAGLREFMQRRLPEYLVPSQYVRLDELPLTLNAKLDRGALQLLSADAEWEEQADAGPGNETEYALVELWEQVLGRQRIGIHDNFFELGGHSLLAVKTMARIEQSFAVTVGLQKFFAAPTVAGLATAIESARLGQESDAHVLLDDIDRMSAEEVQNMLSRM
jgi:acyl carrier protein